MSALVPKIPGEGLDHPYPFHRTGGRGTGTKAHRMIQIEEIPSLPALHECPQLRAQHLVDVIGARRATLEFAVVIEKRNLHVDEWKDRARLVEVDRAGFGNLDTGISGFLPGQYRREIHAKAET